MREAVRDKFAEAGWDTRSNSATRDEPPTLDELHGFLDTTIDVIESFEPGVGEEGSVASVLVNSGERGASVVALVPSGRSLHLQGHPRSCSP